MPEQNIERRVISADDTELRVDGDGGKISGYAARYNKKSVDFGGWDESIAPGAFDECIKDADVRALKNHDANLLLGRTTSGTLRLDANKRGLKYDVDVPGTTTGRDTVEEIRRKDITGNSFSFTVDQDEWVNYPDGTAHRTIIKVRELFDVGPVTFPAYPDTTVAARSFNAWKQQQAAIEEEGETETVVPEEINANEPEPAPEPTSEPATITAEQQLEVERGYRKAERILNRNRRARTPADN